MVSDLSFKRIGNVGGKNTIKIQFTLTSVTQKTQGAKSTIFKETVGGR